MSQLTFNGFVEESPDPASAPAAAATAASWYTGRVLSHSSISTYRACPQKWKFRYVDKVPERPRSFFSFGKSVHSGLEFLFSRLTGPQPTLEEVLEQYKTGWLREGYETPAQEKWFFQEGERILRGFYAKHQDSFKNVFQVEFKFTINIEGVPITGYIDRVDTTPGGGLAIVDYKTGKAFDKTRVRLDPQLTIYQMACRDLFGKPVETVTLYHLNSLTPLTVPAHSSTQEDNMKAAIVETAKGIMESRFEPKVEEKGQCQWCDYAQICPGFSKLKPIGSPLPAPTDSMIALADRFGKLDKKLEDLSAERDELAATLLAHMRATGVEQVDGRYFSVKPKPAGQTGLNATPLPDGPVS